mgnify:CR=1 FL=1
MIKQIQHLLLRLGIPSTYLGYHYLCYALYLCVQNEDHLTSVYKILYADVADHYNTTRCGVEHCIRTVVKHCWDHGNCDLLKEIAKYPLNQKPTNSEFIDILYHHLAQ